MLEIKLAHMSADMASFSQARHQDFATGGQILLFPWPRSDPPLFKL